MAEGVKAKKGTKKTGRRENERRQRKKNNSHFFFAAEDAGLYKNSSRVPPALKKAGALGVVYCGGRLENPDR
jgi:hypothetical protein